LHRKRRKIDFRNFNHLFCFFPELKNVKKVIDDKDRARKASVISEVVETAKAVLTDNPSIPFLVYELNAYAQNKALDGALKQARA
jgi:alanyl-tRNA synthetase